MAGIGDQRERMREDAEARFENDEAPIEDDANQEGARCLCVGAARFSVAVRVRMVMGMIVRVGVHAMSYACDGYFLAAWGLVA